jgi:hypothetical protein
MNTRSKSIRILVLTLAVVTATGAVAWSSRSLEASSTESSYAVDIPHIYMNATSLADYFPLTR